MVMRASKIEERTLPKPLEDIASDLFQEAAQEHKWLELGSGSIRKPLTVDEKFKAFQMLGFAPHGGQEPIARSEAQFRVVGGGRRGGKSTLAAYEALATAIMRPYSLGYAVGPTKELATRVFDVIWRTVDRAGIPCRRKSHMLMLIELENHSIIRGKSADDADQLVGEGLDWVIIDEAAKILPFVWEEMLRPALSDRDGWALFIGTWEGYNWIYDLYQRAGSDSLEGWESFRFASWENTYVFPGGFDDPKIQKAMRDTTTMDDFYEQYGAEPKRSQHVVLPEFRRDVHVRQVPYQPGLPVYLGVDPGGPNPYAVVVAQDLGDDMVGFIDEIYERRVVTEEVCNLIVNNKPWYKDVSHAIIDSAQWFRERYTFQEKSGIAVYPVRKVTTDFITNSLFFYRKYLRDPDRYMYYVQQFMEERSKRDGIELKEIDETFRKRIWTEAEYQITPEQLRECAKIFIDSDHCPFTIQEHQLYQYHRPKMKFTDYSEHPRRAFDHSVDAARYLIWELKRYGPARASESYIE